MKKIVLLSAYLFLFFGITRGQDLIGGPANLSDVRFLSPQTNDFVKSGNVPISHFTGQTDVKVPIYSYSDADFNIPIFLAYNSSGFTPAKREGIVGLDWHINSGAGVITRKVNGFPDDKTGTPDNAEHPTLHGYYYAIKHQLPITTKTKEEIFDPNTGEVIGQAIWHMNNCEVEPDEFNFNIPGLSGKFFIDHTGKVNTSGNRPFKVNLDDFAMQNSGFGDVILPSKIIVTTDDGYIYTFGGTIQHLEVSYEINSDWIISDADGIPVINAWHLTSIKAPNGRTVTYDYKPFLEEVFVPYFSLEDPTHYLLNRHDIAFDHVADVYISGENGIVKYKAASMNDTEGVQTIRTLTKTVYLEKITIDNTTIELKYNEKEKNFYDSEFYSDQFYDQKTLKLDSILIKYNGSEIKRFNLGYKYYGGVNSRLFLTSLQEAGLGSSGYSFYYHKVDPNVSTPTFNLPNPKTHAVDHWGFWNGGSENGPLIPDTDIDEVTGDIIYTTNDREPDVSKCDVGLLSKIVYPTGGYSEFFYEPHEYKRRLDRKSDHAFLPFLYQVTGNAGGARIRQIIDYDGEKLINTREFFYKENYATGGTESSGILLEWPRYVLFWKYDDNINPVEQRTVVRKSSSTISANYCPGENFIHYSEVTEVLKPSNGFINYKFQNYLTYPNSPLLFPDNNLQSIVNQNSQTYIIQLGSFNNVPGQKLNDRSIERGLPSIITTYASKTGGGFYPVKKIETNYSTYSDYTNDYTVGILQTGGIAHSYKQYFYAALPKVITETLYSEEGTKSNNTTTRITYNSTNYPLTKTLFLSDGNTKNTEFRYPLDFVNDADDPLLFSGTTPTSLYYSLPGDVKSIVDLKMNNIINKPIEIINYHNASAVKATYIEHKDFASDPASKNVYPSKLWTLKTSTPIPSFLKAKIEKATWTFVKNSAYDPDYDPENPEHVPNPDATFDEYDDKGNLLQTTDKSLLTKSYLWGYSNKYPIAEITGTSWNQFFYTGFEEEGIYDNNAKAGNNSKPGGYSKTLKNLTPGIYILSYWQKQPDNSWTYYINQELSVSPDLEGNYLLTMENTIHLDELRFYPKSPLIRMSTYTYNPLVGMTSKMDANNKIEYYEYDPNGRLKFIRDNFRNILKKWEYNYQLR